MRTAIVILLLCLTVFAAPAYSADSATVERSLDVGGIKLTLGMPQEIALKSIGEKFSLAEIGKGDWLISDKQGKKVGSVAVKNGNIIRISRSWVESKTEDSRSIADQIISALAAIADKDGEPAVIYTHEIRTPDIKAQEVQITFPHHRVWITLTDKFGVSVGEAIE